MVAIGVAGIVFEQAILETCPVPVGDRVLMAVEEIFNHKAHLLVYRATLIEPTRRFKRNAGLGQLVGHRVHTVTTSVGGQKGRNCAAAVRGHCLTKPLLRKRIFALLEGFHSREESRCRVVGRRWPGGCESRRLSLLQCPRELRSVETIASLRPKHEAAEQPVELPHGLPRSSLPQRAAASCSWAVR